MKLTLEHLSPYLPYGLKLKVYGQTIWEDYETTMECLSKDSQVYFSHDWNNIHNPDYFKPLLRHATSEELKDTQLTWLLSHHYDVFGLIEKQLAVEIK